MTRHVVNWAKLASALNLVCGIEKVSLREVSRQTGIPASGLTKLRQGGKLSADAVASLIAWLTPGDTSVWITTSPRLSSVDEGITD